MGAPIKKVGDQNFAFGKMPADEAVEMTVHLAALGGEALTTVIAAASGSEEEQVAGGLKAVAVLAKALRAEGPGAATAFFKEMFRYVSTIDASGQGHQTDFADFNGKSPLDPWMVAMEALKENFGGFFAESRFASILAAARKKKLQ